MLPKSGQSLSSALYTRAVLGLHGVMEVMGSKIFASGARAEIHCKVQSESTADAEFGLGALSQEDYSTNS